MLKSLLEPYPSPDHHDWSNEYKLDVKLVSTQKTGAPVLGLFKISDSKNQFSNFSSKNPLKLERVLLVQQELSYQPHC